MRPVPPCSAPQVLLQEDPTDQLSTTVRQQAMLAIAAMRYLPQPPPDWPPWCRAAPMALVPGGDHLQSWVRGGGRQQGRGASGFSAKGERQCHGGLRCPPRHEDQPRSPTLESASSLPGPKSISLSPQQSGAASAGEEEQRPPRLLRQHFPPASAAHPGPQSFPLLQGRIRSEP